MYGEYDGHHTYHEGNEGMVYPTLLLWLLFVYLNSGFPSAIPFVMIDKRKRCKDCEIDFRDIDQIYFTIARNQLKFR